MEMAERYGHDREMEKQWRCGWKVMEMEMYEKDSLAETGGKLIC
jgi:hypothetical protein